MVQLWYLGRCFHQKIYEKSCLHPPPTAHLIQAFALDPYLTCCSCVCAPPCTWSWICFFTADLSTDCWTVGRVWLPSPDLLCPNCQVCWDCTPHLAGHCPCLSCCHPWLPDQFALQSSHFCCSLAIACCFVVLRGKKETYRKLHGKAMKTIFFCALFFG